MKNTVLFDLIATQPSPDAKFHGGGEYAKYIFIEALLKNRKFDCVYNPLLELDIEIKKLCSQHKINLYEAKNLKEIESIINTYKYTHFYSAIPYYYGNLKMDSCHFIMTIHGLRDIECPNDRMEIKYRSGFISVLKLKIRNIISPNRIGTRSYKEINSLFSIKKKTIITDSNHSKYSILNFFPKLEISDVKVIYAPYKVLENPKSPNINYGNIKKQYFLLISGNRWIKNNYRAIKAFDELFSHGKLKGKKVIVIGVKNMPKLKKVQNPDNFIFIDYLEEKEFSWFFENAFCFVYPSLNEGYGYPPLHAMSSKVPTIVSAITSIPEVCANGALYFNPYSIEEIKNRILQVNYDKNLYLDLINKGTNRINELLVLQNEFKEELINIIFNSQ